MEEWVEETRQMIAKLSCYLPQQATEDLLKVYLVENEPNHKAEIREQIDSFIGIHLPELLFSERPLVATPPVEKVSGEVRIGTIVSGDMETAEWKLPTQCFCRHVACYGQTGAGKSVLLYNLMDQFVQLKVPFWFFDTKRDGRSLLRRHENLLVVPWRELRFNPLRSPPGMDVKLWWQLFSEVCGHAWGVYHAGINYILEYLDELYTDYSKTGHFPNLLQLYEIMVGRQETTRKRVEYFDVMYNRVRSLVSILEDVVNCETGLKLESLLDRFVVFELDQLRADERNWLIEVMLSWLYAYRLAQSKRGEQLLHAVICDEAHHIWDVNKEFRDTTREMGMPTINLFPTQFRDFGEALILTSQEPSKMTYSIHANTVVKIVGNLGNGYDIWSISEAMGLDDEQRDCIHKLKRGEWLVKMSDYYTEPFMIVTDDYPVEKNVSDQEVEERLRKLLPGFAAEEPKGTRESLEPQVSDSMLLRISEDARALLLDVNQHPFRGISRRQKLLGFSGRRLELAKGELIQRRLVREANVVLGRSRPTKFLVPTDSGLHYLKTVQQSVDAWEFLGRMSFEHRLLQWLSFWVLKQAGYEAFREWDIGDGRRLDVYAKKDGQRIGVEVALNANMEVRKLLASLKNLDQLAIVCNSRRLQEDLELLMDRILYSSVKHKVKVEVANQFLGKWKKDHNNIDAGKTKDA